jgi:DNA-binding LacI/PurR family transcriptional regulator
VNRRLPGIPAVLMDFAHGMKQVTEHLFALGHRRCAFLSGPRTAWSNRERLRGLRAAMRLRRMELVELGPFEPKFEGGREGMDLALGADATAIVAFNDLMALGVLSRLAALGVRVPDKISVVGCDDVLYAAMCAPPLTTVAMPMAAAGQAAVELLLSGQASARKRGRPVIQAKLATELIVRATTAAPAISGRRVLGRHADRRSARSPAE